jgi:DNA-binding transcriptional LysR family regulator
MRLRHIEVFHAVYTSGSITGAAKLLNVSQPSVSKVLAHAEQQLGFLLFDRQKGKIVPTREADRLIVHVNEAYKNISELRRVSRNLGSAETGLVRIAMTPAFGIDLIPLAIASYLEKHPDTMFEMESLHQHQIVRALKEMRVDFGLVFDPPACQGIVIDHLATAEFVAVTRDTLDFAGKSKLRLEELACKPFIKLSSRSPLGQLLDNHIDNLGIEPRIVANVETYQMAKSLVAHGAGVALVDEITARSSGHDNVIARRLDPPMHFNVAIMHAESDPISVVTQQFIDHLKTETQRFLTVPALG